MSKLVEEVLNKNYESANEALSEQFRTILERKMCEMKKMTAAKLSGESLEKEQIDEARINIVKARIRGGVIQRRKKVSNVPGMTLRGGKLTRMSAAERRRRKLGAKKAKLKTRSKQVQIQRNRKLSLMKRKRLGL